MVAGFLYDPLDPELTRGRDVCRRLLDVINSSHRMLPEDPRLARALGELLEGRLGARTYIQPPFYCDYGYNIRLGDDVYMNFGCTLLDIGTITIGSRTMLAPNVQVGLPLVAGCPCSLFDGRASFW